MKTTLVILLTVAIAQLSFGAVDPVVVIDGDELSLGKLKSLMVDAGVVDDDLNWTAPDTSLVVLGAGGRAETINLLAELDARASRSKGGVHLLPGQLDIDLRRSGQSVAAGDWFHNQPYILQIGDTVYTTGGVSSRASGYNVDSLNARIDYEHARYPDLVTELKSMDVDLSTLTLNEALKKFGKKRRYREQARLLSEIDDMLATNEDTPWQYRGTAACHPFSESYNTERFLKMAGAKRIVVQSADGIGTALRMEGMVATIESVNSAADSAVLIVDESGIHTLNGGAVAEEERSISRILSGMSDTELERFLTTATTVRTQDIGTGITKPLRVTQTQDRETQDSVFKYVDTDKGRESKRSYGKRADKSDRFVYEVAAYKLDRLLDLQMVPAAVVTEVNGKRGVVQDWATNAINERDRLENDVEFDSYCKQAEQYRIRIIFDILIHNDDRNLTNLLWNKDGFKLWFIDHSRAFRSSSKRPHQYRKVPIDLSDLARRKLEALDKPQLTSVLGAYLHPRQIDALIRRRDLILEEGDGTEPDQN